MAMISSVKRILFRRSGTLNMFFMLESISGSYSGEGSVRLSVGEGVTLRGRAPVAERRGKHLNRTACSLNGLRRRGREGVGLHLQGAGDLAPTQHLHQTVLVDQ